MELDSKVVRRPSSDIGPDTPINKLRLDEELSPSTENEFNGWLHDDLLQTLRANPDPTVRFILLMQAVNAAKPGAVILKDFHNFFVAQNFVGQHPHIKQFLQDGDFKSVLKSGQCPTSPLHPIRSHTGDRRSRYSLRLDEEAAASRRLRVHGFPTRCVWLTGHLLCTKYCAQRPKTRGVHNSRAMPTFCVTPCKDTWSTRKPRHTLATLLLSNHPAPESRG